MGSQDRPWPAKKANYFYPGTRARRKRHFTILTSTLRPKWLSEYGKTAPHDSLEIPRNVRRSE